MKYTGNNNSIFIHSTGCGQTQHSAHFQSLVLDALLMEALQPLSSELADYHHS